NISRRHARFFRQGGTLMVEDLGSFIDVRVNGGRITGAAALKDGDVVAVGDYKLNVRTERPVGTLQYAQVPVPGVQPATQAAAPASAAAPAPTTAVLPQATTPLQPLDGAPTIPVRTLAEQGLAGGANPPAKLVAMTTNLAGSEFVLDRA